MPDADAVTHFRYMQMQMVQSVKILANSMEHSGPGEASMWERVGVCWPFLFFLLPPPPPPTLIALRLSVQVKVCWLP